jgi:DNA-binding response OmpR family regulator
MPRLLLIEDDELLREMLAAALTDAGHAVIQMADGMRAAEFLDADLVITDLVMPNREGLETIATLHRNRPALPIIVMSGGALDSELYLKVAAKLGARHTLSKPFAPATLLGVIDELLRPSTRPRPASADESPPR